MIVSGSEMTKVRRLARFSLTTGNIDRLAGFYENAFGCRRLASARLSGQQFEMLMDVDGGAESVTLGLGNEIIELLKFDRAGQPYPDGASAADIVFQHFAIVACDIDSAYGQLSAVAGWTAISIAGPQRLPDSSGGVTAFKFRDPDGHPLELLAFPAGNVPLRWRAGTSSNPCLGIDHSAISVSHCTRSIAFYEDLGLVVSARSLNQGAEQERLDGLPAPRADVVALAPAEASPHVELLHYRSVSKRHALKVRGNDIAATRLVLESRTSDPTLPRRVLDPDGHHLLIVPP